VPEVKRSALLTYSAHSLYDIVNDVSAYPEFLPWCGGVEIHRQDSASMEATIKMKMGKLDHRFKTRNTMIPNESISMSLLEGPFSKLEGEWRFSDIENLGSKIEFELSFEVASPITSAIITPAFTHIANTMVDSFCSRARQLHGG
jgi:ribosome-associated toxin RatA of RatAB toxin-antitoxin module